MDSKQEEINEISSAVNELLAKVEKLKSKLDNLCRKTGGCKQIKKINRQLLKKKERINATHITSLREEE